MKNLPPDSIVIRVEEFLSGGNDLETSIKLAIDEETNMIASLLSGGSHLSERGRGVAKVISGEIWKKVNNPL